MNIWVEGKEYSTVTMPNEILALYLRKYIKVDYADSWFPETTKRESYAILFEAANRLTKGANNA